MTDSSHRSSNSSAGATSNCTLPPSEQVLIREFIQALAEEIEAIKKGKGGSIITVYDGSFVRRDGPFYVYIFTTESPLIVMDDAPAEVEVSSQRFAGQIISVQGSDIAVGIEHDFGMSIAKARLITNLWYLLEALRKRYEEVLNGQRILDTHLGQRIFGFVPAMTCVDVGELNLPASANPPNDEQLASIRAACGSDVHFIWGPPGTGKTKTIGFLIAVLLRRNLRVLVVSHTNVATDNAIDSAAKLMLDSEDYQSGKLVRYGNISPNSEPPEMVIPDKIAERLGQHLKEQIVKIQAELEPIQYELNGLREIEMLLARQKEVFRKLGELETNLRRCSQEHETAKSRVSSLVAHLQDTKDKLAEAQAAGKLKRFFFGLDPAKLQTEVAKRETELAAVRRSIAAGTSKMDDIRVALYLAQSEQERYTRESDALLSQYRLDAIRLSSRIGELTKRAEEMMAAIRAIEVELDALLAKILREAKVIATSLTKATIAKQMDDQKFDVFVVDEASMALMPSLYFAAGRATQKAIVIGDFRQLPPIVLADTEMAKNWLGRDIFNQAGVQRAVDEGKQEARLTMLRRQYRMHPEISRISNSIIYDGKLDDCLSDNVLTEIIKFLEKSPFANTPLILYDVSSTNPWSSRLEQGGRYNLYSAVLSAELARRAAKSGIESVGVISPYTIHVRLIKMILDDSIDEKLCLPKVSTVHRFQGMEKDLIIYDVAEGPPLKPWFAKDQGLNSDAAKLINVSITRAKAQIAIIANVNYLTSHLLPGSIILRVLEEAHRRGTIVDSREILNEYLCSEFEQWAKLLDPHDDGINPDDSTLYTESNFYAAFFADLRKTQEEIVIVSPFLAAKRASQFFMLFREKIRQGVVIRVFTQLARSQTGPMVEQAEMVIEELKRIGVEVCQTVGRKNVHQKFSFLDRKIAWEGSLNILSRSKKSSLFPEEHMRRIGTYEHPATKTCKELIKIHKFGSASEVDPGSRRPIQTDRQCPNPDCNGARMIIKRGQYGFFVSCPNYPDCEESFSIKRNDQIGTDVVCPGLDDVQCGKPMVATRGRFGVYLRCSDQNCRITRNIRC